MTIFGLIIKYLLLAIVIIFVIFLMRLFFGFLLKASFKKEAKMNKYDFIMRYPLSWTCLSFITSAGLSLILLLVNIYDEVRLEVNILASPMIVILFFISYAMAREKIVVKREIIKITPVFGKTKTYSFGEIKKLKEVTWSNGTVSNNVYNTNSKKIFSISNHHLGYGLFIQRIKEHNIEIEN